MSVDNLATVLAPSLNGIAIEILLYTKFYFMILLVPFICLIPDITYKFGRAIFKPYPGEIIMIEQKKNPKYLYFESFLKKEIKGFMTGIIVKNRSVG